MVNKEDVWALSTGLVTVERAFVCIRLGIISFKIIILFCAFLYAILIKNRAINRNLEKQNLFLKMILY